MDAIRLCSFMVFFMLLVSQVEPMSDEKRLIKHLLENYEKVGIVGRPVFNTSETLVVEYGVALIKLLEINSVDQTGTFSLWERYSWKDILLQWNPEDFGGVRMINIPITRIWRPDIVLYNMVGPERKNFKGMAVAYRDGHVLWIPTTTITATCLSDGNFPHDTQECQLKYGSWTYDGLKMDLCFYNGLDEIDITDYIHNNDWKLIKTSGKKNVKYYPCCVEPFPDLTFGIKFQRNSTSATVLMNLPTTILFLMILLVFWLHPGSLSKFAIGGVVFLGFLLLMINVAVFYRANKLMMWLVFGMVLTFTAMLTSVISSAVAKKGTTGQALPPFFSMMCMSVFGRILCADRPAQNNSDQSADSKVDHDGRNKEQQQWVAFAQVLDRVGFLIHLLVLIIIAAINA